MNGEKRIFQESENKNIKSECAQMVLNVAAHVRLSVHWKWRSVRRRSLNKWWLVAHSNTRIDCIDFCGAAFHTICRLRVNVTASTIHTHMKTESNSLVVPGHKMPFHIAFHSMWKVLLILFTQLSWYEAHNKWMNVMTANRCGVV